MGQANYTVNELEQFDPKNYLEVVNEISEIREGTILISHSFKADILISFAKTHSLKTSWLQHNPRFAEAITGSFYPLKHIENLFEAGSKYFAFTSQFEEYLRSQFKA